MRDGNVVHERKVIREIKKIALLLCFIPVKVNDLLWLRFRNPVFMRAQTRTLAHR